MPSIPKLKIGQEKGFHDLSNFVKSVKLQNEGAKLLKLPIVDWDGKTIDWTDFNDDGDTTNVRKLVTKYFPKKNKYKVSYLENEDVIVVKRTK